MGKKNLHLFLVQKKNKNEKKRRETALVIT